jgi:hypothetical protein
LPIKIAKDFLILETYQRAQDHVEEA